MATVEKDILYPGNWHLPDGRVFSCSQKDVGYFAKRMQDMIDDGLPIPGAWEHQDKVKPVTKDQWQARNAEMVKLTFGHAEKAKVNASGALEITAEVDDETKPMLKRVKFVSPQIEWNYRDPRGKVWAGPSIVHFAATARPVQVPGRNGSGQQAFRLSSLGDMGEQPICLSMNGYEPVKLGDGMFEKKKKPDETDEAADAAPPPADPEPQPEKSNVAPLTKKPAEEPSVSDGPHPMLLEAKDLSHKLGLQIGDDTTEKNFIDRFIVAAKTKLHLENGDEEEEPPVEQAPPVLNMSATAGLLEKSKAKAASAGDFHDYDALGVGDHAHKHGERGAQASAIAMKSNDPDHHRDASMIHAKPAGVSMSQDKLQRLEALEQADIERRLNVLLHSGRITKPIKDKLTDAAKTISLSAEADTGRDQLLLKIGAYEELPANKTFAPEEIETIQEIPLSGAGPLGRKKGEADREEADKIADELAARGTGQWDEKHGKRRESANGKK